MADITNGNKISADSVEIRLLRNNEKAFVPLTTPDAIIYIDKNDKEQERILDLTTKLEELDNTNIDIYKNIDRIDENIVRIDENIDQIENNVSELYEIKADKSYVEQEVSRLDEDIQNLNENIQRIDENIDQIESNIDRIDDETAKIYIPDWQYPKDPTDMTPDPGTDEYRHVYNKYYVDNYMFNESQTETFIADTVKSQTYNKTEIDKKIGDSLKVLVHSDEENTIQLYEDYKCQYANLTEFKEDNLYIFYPDMPKYEYEGMNPDVEYRYTKILVYIKTGEKVPSVIVKEKDSNENMKSLSLSPNSITEFAFIYMVGNWLISKTIFNG